MPRPRLLPNTQPALLPPGSSTISFRLDPESGGALAARAAQLGVSPHELARHYVIELLHEPAERAALRQGFEQLQTSLQQFRSDFAFAVEAILTSAGQVSKDEASAWVEKSLSAD